MVMALSALGFQTPVAAAQAETVKVTGKQQMIPSVAGAYRVTATCPVGTRPAGGSVSFQEERAGEGVARTGGHKGFVALPHGQWPRRVVGGSLGRSAGNLVYAEFVLASGPRLKARITARCRVVSNFG